MRAFCNTGEVAYSADEAIGQAVASLLQHGQFPGFWANVAQQQSVGSAQ
jgi:hypothetical protein